MSGVTIRVPREIGPRQHGRLEMRRMIGLVVVILLVVAGPVWAGKIGFVDAEKAVMQVQEGQARVKELEAWAEVEQNKIEEAANRVNEIRQQIVKEQSVASQDTVDRLKRDELEARRAFEDAKRIFERDLGTKRDAALGEVAVKVGKVASDYGKANGYDAIFILTAQPIIYLSEESNLTEIVVRLYDERFPAK
jgi:Skp family chaperone for outer membrane proteins